MRASFMLRLAGAALSLAAFGAQATEYTIENLGQGMSGRQVTPLSINQAGIAVGDAYVDSFVQQAVVFGRGRVEVLPRTGTGSTATGINREGKIVGTMSATGHTATRAFGTWRGTTKDLGTLGGNTSTARAINDADQVVGGATNERGVMHAFLYDDGKMKDLGTLGGQTSEALAVSAKGDVVGRAQLYRGDTHAFGYRHGTMKDLGTLGGDYPGGSSIANAVNANGTVAGQSSIAPGSGLVHAFRWTHEEGMDDLGVLQGGQNSFALAINSDDTIVGTSEITGRVFHAFIVRHGDKKNPKKMVDLNSELDRKSGNAWVLTAATGINDEGQIIGYGTHHGSQAAFLLTPKGGPK